MSGFLRSASVNPTALSIARAGARLGPVVSGLDMRQPSLMRLPARIRSERPQRRCEFAEVPQGARARQLVGRRGEIDIEQVFPRPALNRPRFELRQIDA